MFQPVGLNVSPLLSAAPRGQEDPTLSEPYSPLGVTHFLPRGFKHPSVAAASQWVSGETDTVMS